MALGAIIYRIIALVYIRMLANDLKLFTAITVARSIFAGNKNLFASN